MIRGRFGACLVVASAAFPAAARAESAVSRATFAWDNTAAPSCIDQAHLQAAVEARLRRGVFDSDGAAEFVIRGGVSRDSGGWRALVRVWDAQGKYLGDREVASEAPTCAQLGEALGLVLAMIIESPRDHVSLHLPPPPPPPPPPAAAAAPVSVPSPPPHPIPPGPPWRLDSAISAMAGWGVLPNAAYGWKLASSIARGTPRASISLGMWHDVAASLNDIDVRASAWQAGAGVCPIAWASSRWELSACGAISAGQATGRGEGLAVSRSAQPWFVHAEVGPSLSLSATPALFVRAALPVALAVARPRYYYLRADGSEADLWTAPVISPRAELGVGVRVP